MAKLMEKAAAASKREKETEKYAAGQKLARKLSSSRPLRLRNEDPDQDAGAVRNGRLPSPSPSIMASSRKSPARDIRMSNELSGASDSPQSSRGNSTGQGVVSRAVPPPRSARPSGASVDRAPSASASNTNSRAASRQKSRSASGALASKDPMKKGGRVESV